MPTVKIPLYTREPFERLAKLPNAEFQAILESVSNAAPSPDLSGIMAKAEESGVAEAGSIVEAIAVAGSYASARHLQAAEIVAGIAVEDLKLTAKQRETARTRVGALLSTQAVWLSARALDLVLAEPRFMSAARVLTELRPLFGAESEESDLPAPSAALIRHTLIIEYTEAGESRVMALPIDVDDLATVKAALNRAEKKAKALQVFMEGANVIDVSPRGGE